MRIVTLAGWVVGGLAVAGAIVLAARAAETGAEIAASRRAAVAAAARTASPSLQVQALTALPEPVRRWAAFTFPVPPSPGLAWVEVEMDGRFRRPRTEGFSDTTAHQVAAIGTPAMVFDATTPVLGALWARAYDIYVDGHLTMKASLLSAFTVVNEQSTPTLDRISLRRWLIESALYPMALLPGGPVRWEPVDAQRARAVARLGDVEAALVATFAEDGRLLRFDAEEPGDLDTSYHGSGEQVIRDDYRLVDGMMIPHRFRFARVGVSRAGEGQVLPFWEGRLTAVRFGRAGEAPR